MLYNAFIAGLGGFLGAAARVGFISLFKFSWLGILCANVAGSFLAGLLLGLPLETFSIKQRILCVSGFLGAFTTFSAFSAETVIMLKIGNYSLAIANVLLNVVLCLIGAAFGFYFSNYFSTL